MTPLQVLWEDEEILVINKPAGILVHRSAATSLREESLLQLARQHAKTHVFPVHRLDRPTSGVLLFAKSSQAAQFLGQQFQERKVEKIYLAVLRGWLAEMKLLEHPLEDQLRGILQEAKTLFRPLAQVELPVSVDRYPTSRYSLVQALPYSGRRHQIRRHLKHMHHPIIGDSIYGHGPHNRFFREQLACQRLLLHHQSLHFCHPNGESLVITAPLDAEFTAVLKYCGLDPSLRSG